MRPTTGVLLGLVLTAGLATAVVAARNPQPPDPRSPAASPSESRTSTSPSPSVSPPTTEPELQTLVMWARGRLEPDVAEGASRLPDVTATAFVRSGTVGLVGSRGADGAPVDVLADGHRIPVAVMAVEPGRHAATMPSGAAQEAIAALQPGQVVLSETSARLRRLGPGAELDLAGLPGLRVVAVVVDEAVRGAEVVVHAEDAEALDLGRGGSLIVQYRAEAAGAATGLRRELRDLVPELERVRIVDGRGARSRAPLVLSLPAVKDRFGEFSYRPRDGVREIDLDPAFVEENIVTADVPIVGSVRCHRGIVDDLRAALQELVDAGLGQEIDPNRYGGCFHPRRISESRENLSHHSWGIAIDLNVDLSVEGLGPLPPTIVVETFERHGFRWGGDFLQPDNHHFEWVGAEFAQQEPR